jgi:hypothetical protein
MNLTVKDINSNAFNVDLSTAVFEVDALQDDLIQYYLRHDKKFRYAYNINYTPKFLQMIKDKVRLNEVLHLSVVGETRSGKSYGMLTVTILINLLYGRIMTIEYVCSNAMEFLEKIQNMDESELIGSCFQIDEEKKASYGIGSVTKKVKLQDVQNIIAKNKICTISLTPDRWSNEQAIYGLRTLGRDFKNKLVRFMLYNLSGGGNAIKTPMGMVYLPIFTEAYPLDYVQKLQVEYELKKDGWIKEEREGRGDTLYKLKMSVANNLISDENYKKLKFRKEKEVYLGYKLGSEWSKGEIEEIVQLAKLLSNNIIKT